MNTDRLLLIERAMRHLSDIDQDWANLIRIHGPCVLDLQNEREPYEALVRAIAHQQIHGRAAEAILARFITAFPDSSFPRPEAVLACDESVLRSCGFSTNKALAIRDIAAKTLSGVVPNALEATSLSDEDLIARLTLLRGVGRWTVEMLLIFTLGRVDVLPVDDFGVREGWRILKRLPMQPKPKQLAEIGQAWRPFRSIAAWYLWRAADGQNKIKSGLKTKAK